MLATKRRFDPSVIEQIFKAPYRFQFFQAVRMVELWLTRNGISAKRAVSEHVRFINRVSLNFPPSELEAISIFPPQADFSVPALEQALYCGRLKYVNVTPTFMGLLGGNGALPSNYSERIATHQAVARDEGPRAFLDMFSNRSLALFYQAWRKYRLELHYEASGRDRFLPLLLSLSGLGHVALHNRHHEAGGDLLDESLAHFAAAIRHRPASAAYMQQVLADYFCVPLRLEQFVGCWYDVAPAHQTAVGSTNSVLGQTALVGERVWQRDLRLRLKIGPLSRQQFERFLPGAKAAAALEKLLAMFTNVCLEYEVQLVLRADEVVGTDLWSDQIGGRLGWDTFLVTAPEVDDRADVCYQLHALTH